MGNEPGRWYENLTYQELKRFIGSNIRCIAGEFVAVGYYLKQIREGEKYKEDGYKDIWEFAEDMYGISRSTCSRWMAINDKFSENGNSPALAEEYKEYGKSQLQEMLYLEDSQLEAVSPDMTVKDIKGLRKKNAELEDMCGAAQTEPEEKASENSVKPYQRGCITGWSRYPDVCSCCGSGGVECCSQCDNDSCNGRCGWITDPYIPEDAIPGQMTVEDYPELLPETGSCAAPHIDSSSSREEEPEQKKDEPAADAEYQELDDAGRTAVEPAEEPLKENEKYEELSDLSDLELIQDKLEKEKRLLAGMREEFTDHDRRVRTQKLIVGALASYIRDLDDVLNPPPEPVQPELPVLKNNDQRKGWLRSYKDWGLWYEDEHIGCKYYKYDFENGARLIAEVYTVPKNRYRDEYELCFLHLVGGPEPPKDKTRCCGKWQRHETYSRHPDSDTELAEFLKYVQKENRRK